MKQLVIALALIVFSCNAEAQQPAAQASAPPLQQKVLAIGHLTTVATRDKFPAVMPSEVKATVNLYLSWKIEQWFTRNDQNGVVFLMNVSTR